MAHWLSAIGMPPKRPVSRKAAAPVAMEAGGNSDDWANACFIAEELATPTRDAMLYLPFLEQHKGEVEPVRWL